jgi:hypothetical protein
MMRNSSMLLKKNLSQSISIIFNPYEKEITEHAFRLCSVASGSKGIKPPSIQFWLGRNLSAFRDRGVPGPTSEMSPRAPSQMGRRETEREGGKGSRRERWKSRGLRVCPAPKVGCACSRGLQASTREGASGLTRAPVPFSSPRGQPPVRGPWSFLL